MIGFSPSSAQPSDDANQDLRSMRRSGAGGLVELDLAWIEKPLPADDPDGHRRLTRAATTPIAVGESTMRSGISANT
jgi:L-alanine-DL-glutamate epimerase-like enolase superfamily enzyme